MAQRPEQFTLNMSHTLATGLVFAGLGQLPGSTRYADSSPFGNHGTLTNMEPATDWVWSPEIGRTAIDLDGSNDYVNGGDVTILDGATTCSFSVWVNERTWGADEKICVKLGAASNRSWQLTNGASAAPNAIALDIWDGTKRLLKYTSSGVIAEGTWQHLCGVWYGGNVCSIFVNGVSEALTQSVATTPVSITNSSVPMYIGTSDGTAFYLDGTVADMMIYNRAIGDCEIKALADPSNVMLSGLLNYPRRKWWPVVSGGAPPATFKAAWLARQNKVIGGGVT